MITAILALAAALGTVVTAGFAWYVYNTGAHTTRVHLAAGSGMNVQISSAYEGPYSSAAVLESFTGTLDPVSTDSVLSGFQKVTGYVESDEARPRKLAAIFGNGEVSDYYRTTLYLRSMGGGAVVYLSDVGFEDDDPDRPISTAIRIGLVPHEAGRDGAPAGEYIFAINTAANPEADYNTLTGAPGFVLDSARSDGTTIPFSPYTDDNFCILDSSSLSVSLKEASLPICTLSAAEGEYGTPVRLDVYIWLEGCDEDCVSNLSGRTLKNLSLSFAGSLEAGNG